MLHSSLTMHVIAIDIYLLGLVSVNVNYSMSKPHWTHQVYIVLFSITINIYYYTVLISCMVIDWLLWKQCNNILKKDTETAFLSIDQFVFTKGRPKLCVNIRHFILWIAFNYNLIVPFHFINWDNIHVRHMAQRMIISINGMKGIDDANLCWYRRIYFHVQRETYYQWLPIVKGSWSENAFRSRFLKLFVCCIYMSFIANLNQNITLKNRTLYKIK